MDTTSVDKIGKYEVIRKLGQGGFAAVWLARDPDLGRRVAIKLPLPTANPDFLARFVIEGKASTLNHPNIAQVYEKGIQDGLPFIVMEYVEGRTLEDILKDRPPSLDLLDKLRVIEQVCLGLAHAHEKGIIHRDIKPANVIRQADGVAKIIDFGIAKIMTPEANTDLTQRSQLIGSLHYIAPERFKGEAVDGRSDIFSTGVMLYQLLTGKLPFTGGEETTFYKIVNEKHAGLSSYMEDYPPALDAILDMALAKNPSQRYSFAEDFADALHEVIVGLRDSRVGQLLSDAERLTMESRFEPALDLLIEAGKLDPDNTQVKKMRRFVRDRRDKIESANRVRDLMRRADEAMAHEKVDEAILALKEAQGIDSSILELGDRLKVAEEKKRRLELTATTLAMAAQAVGRGDITAALRLLERRLKEDPANARLQAAMADLARQAEREAQKARLDEILENARSAAAARQYAVAEGLLAEAEALDKSHPGIDKLRREMARSRDAEERRQLLDDIQKHVSELVRAENYEAATVLLTQAIETLPAESSSLHRLKANVDAEAHKVRMRRFVEESIVKARELFDRAPLEALALLQTALEQAPGDERLVEYAKSMREQFQALRVDQLQAEALRNARELLAARQFDKAIGALESFQLEFGSRPEMNDLIALARSQRDEMQRATLIERCLAESRSLIQSGRLEDAIRLLETGVRQTNDVRLARLLEEVHGQLAEASRRLDVLQKRVTLLRERGDLDEAIRIIQEHVAKTPNPQVQELLTALEGERQQKQATQAAIGTARQAAQQFEFSRGWEALQAVIRAYGESPELTQAQEDLKAARAARAQEVVAASIDAARAALLKSDPKGALAALQTATSLVEFADPKKQADWQRIWQTVQKALPEATLDIPVPLPAPQRFPIWIVAAVAIAVVAIGSLVVWKLWPTPPIAPTTGFIQIKIKNPSAGAHLSVPGYPDQTFGPDGTATVEVSPATHHWKVYADGYIPIEDDVDVKAGGTEIESITLKEKPRVGTTGTLIVHGNLDRFRMYVDGDFIGLKQNGDKITLSQGDRTIRYETLDKSDAQEHKLTIAANGDKPDSFTLKVPQTPPPPVQLGRLTITTQPGARVSVDGSFRGVADQGGNLTVDQLTLTTHAVAVEADNFNSESRQPTIVAGQNQLSVPLTPKPQLPTTGSLTIQTNPGASISIDNGRVTGKAGGDGKFSASGQPVGSHTVDIELNDYQSSTGNPIEVTAGGTASLRAMLNPNLKPVETTIIKEPQHPDPAVVERPGIEKARQNFIAAFRSRDMGQVSKQWLAAKTENPRLGELLGDAKTASIEESCGTPRVSGTNAELDCSEISTYDGVKKPPLSVTWKLEKHGETWVFAHKSLRR
jgi:serine/threonine-protein kinase